MTITRVLTKEDMKAARFVWETCFPDDEAAFVDYYFKKRTHPEWIMGAFEGERLIGTVHMLPQTARFFGLERHGCFVAGVATLPEERGRGIAESMLAAAFSTMLERGFSHTTLKPFSEKLARYYERFGYEPFACRDEYELSLSDFSDVKDVSVHVPDASELLSIYTAFAARYNGMRVRQEADLSLLIEELSTYESALLSDGKAYAACYLKDGAAHAFELAGEHPAPLLKALCKRYGTVHAAVSAGTPLLQGKTPSCEPFNMLKVLDETAFLQGLPVSVAQLLEQKETNYSFEVY
ncbi:MAG TPA: GNAT family N-acetyltransferase [Clostridia bacterium]|nr:GNAT family N-acetyltransferase [Clostridia bacterium]